MTTATCVRKAVVVAALRSQDLHRRADWVDRDLPTMIDTAKNASLLQTLGVDVDELTSDTDDGVADRQ